MFRRRLVRSRNEARTLILSGHVLVDGLPVRKPSTSTDEHTDIRVTERHCWVSRGGFKLDAAIEEFDIAVEGRVGVDAGASTGGFTDVLLQRGARTVFSIDVGSAQLHPRLLADPRVVSFERTNIRDVTAEMLGGPKDLVVADLSFVSLTKAADALARLLGPEGDMIVLVKPQFEVGRDRVGRDGVVKDPALRARAVNDVASALESVGVGPQGVMTSPIEGGDGNVEFLLWAQPGAGRVELEVAR